MSKRVPINILNDILLPGSVVGAYMSIYYNLFIYWVWSNLYELKKFYAIPFIVIAIIAISIIIYLLGKNYDRKLLYIISGSFLPFIIVSLFSVIMLLLLPENLRSNNIALSLVLISTFIVQIPFVLASYIIFSLLNGYCNPKLNHLITVSILITICPLVYPLFIPFFMIADGFATIKPEEVSLYSIIAGFVYSLPFALYYSIKKNKPLSILERWGMDEKMFLGNPLGLEKVESPWVKRGLVVVCVLGLTYLFYFAILGIISIIIAMAN